MMSGRRGAPGDQAVRWGGTGRGVPAHGADPSGLQRCGTEERTSLPGSDVDEQCTAGCPVGRRADRTAGPVREEERGSWSIYRSLWWASLLGAMAHGLRSEERRVG